KRIPTRKNSKQSMLRGIAIEYRSQKKTIQSCLPSQALLPSFATKSCSLYSFEVPYLRQQSEATNQDIFWRRVKKHRGRTHVLYPGYSWPDIELTWRLKNHKEPFPFVEVHSIQ